MTKENDTRGKDDHLPKKKVNAIVPTEYQEACTFVDWLELMKQQGKILDYCHIVNESYGGTRADMLRGAKLKRMGRKRGVFDYQIFIPTLYGWHRDEHDDVMVGWKSEHSQAGHLVSISMICVELKKVKGGKASPEQSHWREVYKLCGIPAEFCRGAQEAIDFVKMFID